jgi:light-regulated signal transduction histidine kinase (bacteriophytochrome)
MTNFPAEHWDEIWRVLEDAKLFRFEATAIRKDGEQFPLDASFNFFEFEGEDYMLVFGRDITERRVAEQKQEALNMELVSANKELSDFAYVVSHDLKAPLRGIGSLANWLAADYSQVLDENGRRQLELLLDRAQRMESLIESILQYSRVGRLREEKESVDLNALVPSVVEMLAVPPDIEVIIDELPTVTGEKTRLGQVFQNLIWNAVKFNDRETGGKVEVSCIDMGDTWRFAVEDNGPGIEEKYHERIFGIFQTLQAGDDKESTGVGLTLVKKIVEMHGGRVWLVSKPGEGTTFYFTLPRD